MRNRVALALAVIELFFATLIWELVPHQEVAANPGQSFGTGFTWVFIHWLFNGYEISPLNLWPKIARSVAQTALATLGLTSFLTLAFDWQNSAFELLEISLALLIGMQLLRTAFGFAVQFLIRRKLLPYQALLLESASHRLDLANVFAAEVGQLKIIEVDDDSAELRDYREVLQSQAVLAGVQVVVIDHHIPFSNDVISELSVFLNKQGIEVISTRNPAVRSSSFLHYWSHHVMPVENFREPSLDFPNSVVKAVSDYLWALLGLVLFGPVMLYTAIRLKLSGNRILTKYRAVGQNSKTFHFYEFNVFQPGVDSLDISILRLTNRDAADDRFTEFGKFLRKYAFEELPMLFAVLAGKMHLIGPRPVIENKSDLENISNQRRMFMRPGITGLWVLEDAVHTRDEELMQLVYAQHWSLGMDFKILVLTVYRMLRGDIANRN